MIIRSKTIFTVMDLPVRSSDLSPAQHVWDASGRAIGCRQPHFLGPSSCKIVTFGRIGVTAKVTDRHSQ
ncbi:hypothetical protein TNCV_2875571 [Trichonephila clavipes]|nr:hypothetical protein TNCV_2875571 [Trichonephila clavipes]